MPAETHQQRGAIEIGELIELVTVLVRPPDDGSLHPGEPLQAVGLGDQASHWALWDAIVDEFGERGSTEAGDADDLVDVETVGELVEVFARWLGWQGEPPADHATTG